MSTLAEKMDKQFEWQNTRFMTSGDRSDLFLSVGHLTTYLAEQMRADPKLLRQQVKAELERRADAGRVRRWHEVYGQSAREDRVDHYYLTEQS